MQTETLALGGFAIAVIILGAVAVISLLVTFNFLLEREPRKAMGSLTTFLVTAAPLLALIIAAVLA